jgi:hypothetical protein
MSPQELHGKKVRAEYRIGRRTHQIGIGTLRVELTGIELVFPHTSRSGEQAYIFKLTEQQTKRIIPVQHSEYDFQFSGTLDREEGISEDDGAWTRPPKIVTIDDSTPNA